MDLFSIGLRFKVLGIPDLSGALMLLEAQHPFLGRSAGLEDLQRPCCKERPCAG